MVDTSDLERKPVQFATREAVAVAMETPLREPIVEAVENSVGASDERPLLAAEDSTAGTSTITADETDAGTDGGGRSTTLQGLVAFVAAFLVLYAVVRRFSGDE